MLLEQKRLQLPTKFSDVVVGLTNPGWQTVPEPWSSGCEAPIAEPCVGPWNAARVGVRDKLAVIYKICCSCIMQRLVDQDGQLEIDSLSDWKPVVPSILSFVSLQCMYLKLQLVSLMTLLFCLSSCQEPKNLTCKYVGK